MTAQPMTFTEPFPEGDVLHFEGRGGKTFDYIEDETVMDRLDAVVGPSNWSIFVEPISVADGIVKVRLEVGGATYEDFGYQNRADGEGLKEAVSDGIRRVGRMAGIARYLYHKHPSKGAGAPAARATAAGPVPLRPAAVANPYADDPYPADIHEMPLARTPAVDQANCPEHGDAWRGDPGDLYHKKDDGRYCRHPNNTPKPRR